MLGIEFFVPTGGLIMKSLVRFLFYFAILGLGGFILHTLLIFPLLGRLILNVGDVFFVAYGLLLAYLYILFFRIYSLIYPKKKRSLIALKFIAKKKETQKL